MVLENWKTIELAPNYEVSDLGKVKNKKTGYILKPSKTKRGYLKVGLNKKSYFVHRLVAFAFLPAIEGMNEVNHKSGQKDLNVVWNLEWTNRQGNILHAIHVLGKQLGNKPNQPVGKRKLNKGVGEWFIGEKRFRVTVGGFKRQRTVGYFNTFAEAIEAHRVAHLDLYGCEPNSDYIDPSEVQ